MAYFFFSNIYKQQKMHGIGIKKVHFFIHYLRPWLEYNRDTP